MVKKASNVDQSLNAGKAVFNYRRTTLLHYRNPVRTPQNVIKTPLVVVFALINRPYILDLSSGKSFIKELVKNGLDVYLIDWGYPDAEDASLSLENYILEHMDHCINYVLKKTKKRKVNLLGVCQGGVFNVCYSCVYPGRVKNLITITTPVDFHGRDNLITQLVKQVRFDLLPAGRNIPGQWLTQFFLSLKPFQQLSGKYVELVERAGDLAYLNTFLELEKWIHDNPDQAYRAFMEFVTEFYLKNNLVKGRFKLGKHKVDLRKITMPVLNVVALKDHIIPPGAARALKRYVRSRDYTLLEVDSGHIGIYINTHALDSLVGYTVQWLRKHL